MIAAQKSSNFRFKNHLQKNYEVNLNENLAIVSDSQEVPWLFCNLWIGMGRLCNLLNTQSSWKDGELIQMNYGNFFDWNKFWANDHSWLIVLFIFNSVLTFGIKGLLCFCYAVCFLNHSDSHEFYK